MTHYDVKYEDLDSEETIEKACADVKDYVGDTTYSKMIIMAMDPDITLDQLRFAYSFAGVQGYPVKAMYLKYGVV